MKSSTNNPWEQLFRTMGAEFAKQAKEAYIGTVSSVSASGISLSIDGDSSGAKKYTCARSERFSPGDRVLIMRESGTYVVVCRIGAPGGPDAKTSAMTQAVGVDSAGKLWTTPNTYTLPTATVSDLGGVKTSEAYAAAKHKLTVAVNSAGQLYAEEKSYSLPTATTTVLGGVKGAAAYSASTHTQAVTVDSAGKLWTAPASSYTLPTATTTVLGGVKGAAAYSASTHTQAVAVDSAGKLWTAPGSSYTLPTASNTTLGGVKPAAKTTAMTQSVGVDSNGALWTEPAGNVNKIYSGTSTTNYLELDATKVLKPNGTNFALGTTTYPFSEVYFGKEGSTNCYLKAAKGSIIPNTTFALDGYLDLGSAAYPFNRIYAKKIYLNGRELTA